MENLTAIFTLKFYTGSFALDYKPLISEEIEQWIAKNSTPVIIDCWGVHTIFSVYFNSLLFDLIQKLGIKQFNSMVSFENLNELNERTYILSKRHVERYCTDPDYRECVNLITAKVTADDN